MEKSSPVTPQPPTVPIEPLVIIRKKEVDPFASFFVIAWGNWIDDPAAYGAEHTKPAFVAQDDLNFDGKG